MEFDKASYRFGSSATIEGRYDGADLLLRAITGDVVAYSTEKDLMEEGWIATPIVYMVSCPAGHNSIYEWSSIYNEGIVYNNIRNRYIRDIYLSLVKQDKRVLVLCNYIEHGEILEKLISETVPIKFIHGSTPSNVREQEILNFKESMSAGIILSTIGDEGLDLPKCDVMINVAGGKSSIKTLQKAGRAMRPKQGNKAIIIDFIDIDGQHSILLSHSYTRMRTYKKRSFEVKIITKKEDIL